MVARIYMKCDRNKSSTSNLHLIPRIRLIQNCTRFPYLLAAWRDVEHSLGLETMFKGLLDDGLYATHVLVRRIGAGTN